MRIDLQENQMKIKINNSFRDTREYLRTKPGMMKGEKVN